MPIISRQLDYAHVQADGSVKVRERHTDNRGRHHYRAYRAASEAEAAANLNARDLTAQLRDGEENEAVVFIQNGGSPAAFARTDLTAGQLRRRLIRRFAQNRVVDDDRFMLRVANWISGQSAATLSTALGISQAKAQAIIDRAVNMLAIKTTLEADDVLVGEV